MATATLSRGMLRSEWTKLRSVRSSVWSLVAMVVLALGITVLVTSLYTANWDDPQAGERRAEALADPVGLILQPSSLYAQIAVCVLGVMVIASEYSTGMIRSSLLAVPRRTPVLAAKAVVFAGVIFVVTEIVAFGSFAVGRAIVHEHLPISLGDPGVPRAIVGFGLYLALMGLFALALGALIRHTAGAITLTLVFVLFISMITQLLPGSVGRHIDAYMPSNAGIQIMASGNDPTKLLSPWQGLGVLCLWVVVLLTAAGYLLNRRDA